jgi:hypothetical protein
MVVAVEAGTVEGGIVRIDPAVNVIPLPMPTLEDSPPFHSRTPRWT